MRIFIFLAVLAVPLLVAGMGQAQTFTLKAKEYPAVGKSIVITDSGTTNFAFTVSTGGKVLKDDKKVEVLEKQYTQKVLEAGAKRPNKYTNTYTKAAKGEKGAPKKLSYESKTIIIERKGEKYVVRPEEGDIDPKDLEDFTKQVNRPLTSDIFLPKKAVAVGDSWPLDKHAIEALGGDLDDGVDLTKFKGQGKFLKAYKKGKEQWGTIEIAVSVPLKKLGPLPLDKPITMHAKMILDAAIDGSSTAMEAKGTVSIKGQSEFTQNNMTFMLDIAIDGQMRLEQSAEK